MTSGKRPLRLAFCGLVRAGKLWGDAPWCTTPLQRAHQRVTHATPNAVRPGPLLPTTRQVTPTVIRLRKRILDPDTRDKASRSQAKAFKAEAAKA